MSVVRGLLETHVVKHILLQYVYLILLCATEYVSTLPDHELSWTYYVSKE